MSKKVHIVTKIARQYEGEYIFVSVLGAFNELENAKAYLNGKDLRFAEKVNGVDCVVEMGVIQDIEVLDEPTS